MTDTVTGPFVTPTQAAARLGVTRQTLARWIREGRGPRSYWIGKSRRFRVEDVDALISKRRED